LNDNMLLHQVRERSEDALERIVIKYTAYVVSVEKPSVEQGDGSSAWHKDGEITVSFCEINEAIS